jgi:hypothetical protein
LASASIRDGEAIPEAFAHVSAHVKKIVPRLVVAGEQRTIASVPGRPPSVRLWSEVRESAGTEFIIAF